VSFYGPLVHTENSRVPESCRWPRGIAARLGLSS